MLTSLRQALRTVELDEREQTSLLFGIGPVAGCAPIGIILGRVLAVLLNDRRLLRAWLSEPSELLT